MMLNRRLARAAAPLVLALTLAAAPAAAGPAKDLITDLAVKAEPILNDRAQPTLERAQKVQALLSDLIDRRTMAQSLLGRHWHRATPEQQAELIDLLESYLVEGYARRMESVEGQISFQVEQERELGDRTLVDTQVVRPNGPPVAVTWQVETVDGKPTVTDIVVEGVSLIVSQRADFASVIRQQGGVDGLIALLRDKVKQ